MLPLLAIGELAFLTLSMSTATLMVPTPLTLVKYAV